MELIAVPKGMFSRAYDLTLDGEPLGSVDPRFWSEGLDIELAHGREYTLEKQGSIFSSHFQLREKRSGRLVAEGDREGFLSTTWVLMIERRTCTLERKGWFKRGYRIFHDGVQIGETEPLSMWSRGFRIEATHALPETGFLFLALMRILIAQREAASASAAS